MHPSVAKEARARVRLFTSFKLIYLFIYLFINIAAKYANLVPYYYVNNKRQCPLRVASGGSSKAAASLFFDLSFSFLLATARRCFVAGKRPFGRGYFHQLFSGGCFFSPIVHFSSGDVALLLGLGRKSSMLE